MRLLERSRSGLTIYLLGGAPSFVATDRLADRLLMEAELPLNTRSPGEVASPTLFHLALDGAGAPVGVASSVIGPWRQLPVARMLAANGAEVVDPGLPDPACELTSISVHEAGSKGVAEALYRSFYRRAVREGAASIVVALEPWLFDSLREEYRIPLRTIGGSVREAGGRELLPAGGVIDDLEVGVMRHAPTFASYLMETYHLTS